MAFRRKGYFKREVGKKRRIEPAIERSTSELLAQQCEEAPDVNRTRDHSKIVHFDVKF